MYSVNTEQRKLGVLYDDSKVLVTRRGWPWYLGTKVRILLSSR